MIDYLLLLLSMIVLTCLLVGGSPWIAIVAYWGVVVTKNFISSHKKK